MDSQLKALWEEFSSLSYPPQARMPALHFELVDSNIAGCISSYIASGTIDNERMESFKSSLEYIDQHKDSLPAEARDYFDKLMTMGQLMERALSGKKIFEIDGAKFSSPEEFYEEFSEYVIPGVYWGKNLDALNDVLYGGFGTPEEGFVLVWKHSDISKAKLADTFDTIVEIIKGHKTVDLRLE